MTTLTHWIGTDAGLVRAHNEDAFLWLGPDETEGHGWLWVLADGMGGGSAGDVASALVITAFRDLWAEAIDELGTPYPAFERILQEANRTILATTEIHPDLRGMGASVAALAIDDGKAWIAHVGNARVYWLHNGRLEALTRDHAYPPTMMSSGRNFADKSDAGVGPGGLTRVVGQPKLDVDLGSMRPLPVVSESFLLCTDGVWDHVDENHMKAALQHLPARGAVEAVVELARRGWSDDNLTAAVVRMQPPVLSKYATRDAFLQWAGGTESSLADSGTLLMQRPDVSQGDLPPRTNVQGIPRVRADVRDAPDDAPSHLATALYSVDDIRRWHAAALKKVTTNPAAPDESSEGATSTMAFSPVDLAALEQRADKLADAGSVADTPQAAGHRASGDSIENQVSPVSTVGAGPPNDPAEVAASHAYARTMGFSLADVRAAEAAGASLTAASLAGAAGGDAGSQVATADSDSDKGGSEHRRAGIGVTLQPASAPPTSGNASTLFFSPDLASQANAEPAAPRQRERLVRLSPGEAAAASRKQARDATVMLSKGEIDSMLDESIQLPKSRWPLVVVVLLFIALGLCGAWWVASRSSGPATEESGDAKLDGELDHELVADAHAVLRTAHEVRVEGAA